MAGANFLDQHIRKVLRTSSKPNATSLTAAGLRYKLSGRNAHGLPAAKNLVANRSGRARPNCNARLTHKKSAVVRAIGRAKVGLQSRALGTASTTAFRQLRSLAGAC